jgi:peptide/nickel transport system substrate-binding protein
MIGMNLKTPTDPSNGQFNPFLDKRVRLAANLAVDIDAIIQNVVTGYEEYAYGASTLGLGFPKDLPSKRFGYDPEQAKALLAEAGYPNGFDTTMVGPLGRWPDSRAVMEAAAGYLAEVGIRAVVSEAQYQEVVQQIQAGTFSLLSFWSTSGGADPGATFRYSYHSTGNFSMGGTPDLRQDGTVGPDDTTALIDGLIEQSEQEFDPVKRAALLEQVITQYYLSAKNIYLYQPVTIVALTKDWNWDVHYASQVLPEYWNIQPKV